MKRTRTVSSSSSVANVQKYASLSSQSSANRIRCNLPPHDPLAFDNLTAYESHYVAEHSHRCTECASNLPSAHLLELHIAENHDPFQAARKEAGDKTYRCFLESCDKVCSDWQKRRRHLIDKHGYPRNYDFFIVWNGVDGRSSLLRRGVDEEGRPEIRQHIKDESTSPVSIGDSEKATSVSETSQPSAQPEDVDTLSSALASMKIIPSSVSFGRQKGRTGFSKK